jgi:hypothetical protein
MDAQTAAWVWAATGLSWTALAFSTGAMAASVVKAKASAIINIDFFI